MFTCFFVAIFVFLTCNLTVQSDWRGQKKSRLLLRFGGKNISATCEITLSYTIYSAETDQISDTLL